MIEKHSTANIPQTKGTYWVKTKDSNGQEITICAYYANNMQQHILQQDKTQWLNGVFDKIWIEYSFDIRQAA